MATPVVYAVIKFRPYTETEEFANVGIVACSPDFGFFDFKVEKNFSRITAFFRELDGSLAKKATEYIADELQRIKDYSVKCNSNSLLRIFNETVKTKEGMICYSNTKVAMTDNPKAKIEAIFQHFVNHSFTKTQSHTQQLELRMKEMLSIHNLSALFTKKDITNGMVKATIPFVKKQNDITRIIKPLSFIGVESSNIIDVGSRWYGKFKWLISDDTLEPRNILVPIEMPIGENKQISIATQETIKELEKLNLKVITADQADSIIEFATAI